MEKFSHTPGPWEIKEGDTLIIANVVDTQDDYDYLMVAGVVGLPDDPVALANLALIAAAPELLEALRVADDAIKEMFRYYDGGETRGSYDGKPERAQLRKAGYTARAAIAKAMGE